MAELIKSDLEFILEQIQLAEAHAAGADLTTLMPNVQVPFGLRTVDGTFNHLVLGQSEFGAADTVFPRLTDPVFRNEGDDTFVPVTTNNNYAANGDVVDADPRLITNLIVDQTANNPAAMAAADATPGSETVVSPGLDGIFGTADDTDVFFIPNIKPDTGLSAPFNPWFTFFGQFFDHGLDLVTKGGNGTVFIPLQADDPLVAGADGIFGNADDLPASQRFMVLTRATNIAVHPGPDNILGTADDIHDNENTTSPFVDQNQTYTSHPAHQVFLRAYEFNAVGDPVATGKLIVNRLLGADGRFGGTGANADTILGGMATWGVVKAQARDLLGIRLTDFDAVNVPLVRVDPYGNFVPGPNGFAQLIVGLGADGLAQTADDVLLEGNPAANGGQGVFIPLTAPRTGHQFLIDIAHSANPFNDFGVPLTPDADNIIGNTPAAGFYDNELLDAHYMAGDGRVNENIGLTAVHHMFHAEHNRQVDRIRATLLADATATGSTTFLNQWLTTPVAAVPANPATLVWDGERLFQAAKFATEMQYQHLVFEEFARTMQPNVDAFLAPNGFDTTINPAIVAEFAHTVFRLGHSMLLETVDRFNADFTTVDANGEQIGLIAAFLNPLAFATSGPTPEQATGAIVRGVTRQVGNEIDEFVTEALRNNLLGLPLDLPTINLTRGRDTGIPSLNAARREFYSDTGDSQLKPYTSWADFVQHMKHPESLINFIAAYGTHPAITGAPTLAAKRAAAMAIVLGGAGAPADRLAFLNSTGTWANTAAGVTTTGLDSVDLWIGGLAEEQMPFGGLLGSTFNFVFENQLEKLQDGDRFYYLERTAGLNFNTELENNSFAKLIMANTDATHLPGLVFKAPAFTFEVDTTKQFTGLNEPGLDGIQGTSDDVNGLDGIPGNSDPVGGILLTSLVIRDNPTTPGPDTNYLQYTGEDHVVLGGTAGNDIIRSSEGDDTVYGDAGNDRLDGGDGNDFVLGGAGDDILTDTGGDDNMQGGDGNDVIQGGNGLNLVLGGFGSDFIITGEDSSEAFGGPGNDFILGSKANEQDMGNEGDDWLEAGTADGAPGDNFDPLGNDPIAGNDVYIGRGENDKFNAEGGDDIMVGSTGLGDRYIGASGFDWATFKDEAAGVGIDMNLRAFFAPVDGPVALGVAARFDAVEGLSGSRHGDLLRGDDADAITIPLAGAQGSVLKNFDLISGLRAFVGAAGAGPDGILGNADDQFGAGNILLGGQGSDIIEGRAGDDLIDGDRWLNVRISVRQNLDGTGPEIASFDHMTDMVPFMVNGTYNPGQLVIQREILPSSGFNFDTAWFSGPEGNYTVTINADGSVTVTDTVGTDGTDRLTGIERLQFADLAVVLAPGLNNEPVGSLTVSDTTPRVGQTLTVSGAGLFDADNTATNGAVPGHFDFFWQVEARAGSGIFEDIITVTGLGAGNATGSSFTVTPDLDGLVLRVRGIYQDQHGVLETVFSAQTAPVALVGVDNNAPVGTVVISDTTPTEGHSLTATNAFTDADGVTTAVFAYQWFRSNLTGTLLTPITGATTSTYTPVQADVGGRLQVRVSYVDDHGTAETVTSAFTGGVGDLIIGTPAVNTLTGTVFDDDIRGLGGNDIINALGGNDLIAGGTGDDTLNGGDGDDTFLYTIGDGADAVNGGAGADTLTITGTAATQTLTVVFNGTALTNVAGGAVTGVEVVMADLLGGVDTLSYGTTTAAVTVTLGTGTASGFTKIANIENATGGSGADRFIATVGDGNNTYSGGAGSDTYDLSATAAGATVTTTAATSTAIGTDTLVSIENLIGSQGNDTITLNGDVNVIDGQGGNDMINAGAGNDTISGGDGNDTLIGGTGNDVLNGGAGNDTFLYTLGDGTDTITGGADADTLRVTGLVSNDTLNVTFNGTALTSVATSTVTGVEAVTADLLGGSDTLNYGTTTTAPVTVNLATGSASGFTVISNIENVTGDTGNDTLTGDAGANTLNGGGGNDVLSGGLGNDVLTGGAGNDTASYASESDAMVVDLAAGTARRGSAAAAVEDTLATLENVTGGTGNDTLTGDGNANVLDGGLGNDTLNGGLGNDRLIGGAGDDTLNGGLLGSDVFVCTPGFGHDTIQAAGFDGGTLAQDRLDISALGITAATFGTSVSITTTPISLGNPIPDVTITIGTNSIFLENYVAAVQGAITQADFILAP